MSESFHIVYPDGTSEDDAAPVMFAVRRPGQVAAQADPSGAIVFRGARSGNSNFDPATGQFAGSKPKKLSVVAQTVNAGAPLMRSGAPQGVDPLVWERRLDTVREAARQDEMMDQASATQFLTGKVPDVTQVDINSFLNDVSAQRLADLVDTLDQQFKPRRERPDVKVAASAGWVRRAMAELDTAHLLHLAKRLEGKGWSPEDINKMFVSKVKNAENKKALQQLYGETQLPTEKTKEVKTSGQ
ncbi:MAG TPA: hypothetical protein VNS88_15220 [Nitrospiraceae bacterium]|nr:hypothetical protein [Nitrospiraceae bacterium]